MAKICIACDVSKTKTWNVYRCVHCGVMPICDECLFPRKNICEHLFNRYVCVLCNPCPCRKTALAFAALRSAEAGRNAWADIIEWVIARMN
jgi:hypothetical protein